MIEITAEVRAAIDRAAGDMELAGDEYIEPADGLIHCKKCHGSRQTVVPRFGDSGYFMPRCLKPLPAESAGGTESHGGTEGTHGAYQTPEGTGASGQIPL